MWNTQNKQHNMIVGLIIVLAGLSRLFVHIPNMAPIGALALFAGAKLADKRMSFIATFMALLLGDLILAFQNGGFYSSYLGSPDMIVNYILFGVYVIYGTRIGNEGRILKVASYTVIGSVTFFVLSNFFAWVSGHGVSYTHDLAGLGSCFAAGLPFFKYTLGGDALYVVIFFGLFELVKRSIPVSQKA